MSRYGYLNYRADDDIPLPQNLPAPVLEFRAMVDEKKHLTSFWYYVLNKDNADKWQNVTKKLYAGALDVDEFIKEGKKSLTFS